jgi:hypothetical protein
MKTLEDPLCLEEILERLSKLSPDSKKVWGSMTPQEMLCHLADSCECVFGRGASTPDANAFKRAILKYIALNVPIKWPHGIITRPAFDPKREGTKPTLFEQDKARALLLLKKLARVTTIPPEIQHPIFGVLNPLEWKRWGYLHADHHLRQFSL